MKTNRERASVLLNWIFANWVNRECADADAIDAIERALNEARDAALEEAANVADSKAEDQWKARGDDEEVFACEHAAMILEETRNAIRALKSNAGEGK